MIARPRRLRRLPRLRDLVRETTLTVDDLVCPVFVRHGVGARPIGSMPGVQQWPLDRVVMEAVEIAALGIPAILLFGIPATKDEQGSEAYASDGVVQQAVRLIKQAVPNLLIITDVCLCEYTSHGHCGLLNGSVDGGAASPLPDDYLLNDETLDVLGRVAFSQVEAGADVVAPSAMIDGMVGRIRSVLDAAGYAHIPILSYSAKYASSFYGPFREAAEGAPRSGDRSSHQMDPGNAHEALHECALDVAEGADMLMVKPALAYLDVIRLTRDRFPTVPLAAYNVSGEYAMLKAAAANGWIDERRAVLEVVGAMRRAGADFVITYHAKDVARWLSQRHLGPT